MKKVIFSFLFLISVFSFAQSKSNLKAKESAEFKDKVRSGAVLSIHTSQSGLTGIVRNSKKTYCLMFLMSHLTELKTF
ncbi:hypothetical protein [Jejuia spongiicola]|uniref:Uncharacterized protein n=1 Tax=Jejuia spongiicola TaxID=2942207 RepID=A0ABT0QE35_9FLAO|nr:hypothetical protein [Jejuia spongiicola]MCL6295228.1 hypothetical protein [Jejuia spongiicola]